MSGLPPLAGDPAAVRLLADRLASSSRSLSSIAGVLVRLRDGATWEGPAGDAFGRRLHEVAPVLDAVAIRLGGAAPPLRLLADAMEEAQHVVTPAVRDAEDAEHAYAVLEDRAYALLSTGSSEESPDVLVVRHLQREQVELRALARARHSAAVERFREADVRCSRALDALAVDGLTDSLPYRALTRASSVGHGVSALGPAAVAVPWLRPLVAGGDVVAVAADAGLLVGYGEGDAAALAVGAALAAGGGAAGALRRGAVAGAERTTTGVAVTRRLTAQERLEVGAVAEVRHRRDELRRRFTVPPDRGTPSSLLGGPTGSRPRRWWPVAPGDGGPARAGGSRAAAGVAAARAALDATVTRARAQVGARADAAFRHDWQLATANGLSAQRMYAAGATLEVATRAGEGAVATVDAGARSTTPTERRPTGPPPATVPGGGACH
ncbi:MAG TPA: hypothetical protein VFI44_02830 [Ornithinibacter sp.]|nr:hypothetical protein [Ornithinibacter sp.]